MTARSLSHEVTVFYIYLYKGSFFRLDKRSERAEQKTNKRWKRTTARKGHPVEKEPPVNAPKLALSDEWKDELRRRDEEMIQVQEFETER